VAHASYRRAVIPLTVLRRLDYVLGKTKSEVIAWHKKPRRF
jgi:hypothetical protein